IAVCCTSRAGSSVGVALRGGSRSCRISTSARSLKSSWAWSWIVWSSRRTSNVVPLKSKRLPSSRCVWWIALSTSCRSSSHTTSKDGMKPGSVRGGLHHVNPGRRGEREPRRLDLSVAFLIGKRDPRRGPGGVRDLRLGDRRVALPHREPEHAEGRVLLRDELQLPRVRRFLLEARVEV